MSRQRLAALVARSPLGSAWAAWCRFWFTPSSPVALGLFRILFGALMLLMVALLLPDLFTWFGRGGPFTPHDAASFWGSVPDASLLLWFPAPAAVLGFFALFSLAALCLLLGLYTRLSALVVFVGLVSIGHRAPLILNGGDTALRLMAFYLLLAPAGAALSLDRLRALWRGQASVQPPLLPPWAQRLLQLQLCLVYAMTVLLKLQGHAWQDGTALYYTSHLEAFARFPVPLLYSRLWLVNLLSYWTLAVELGLAFLLFVPGLRRFLLLNGVLLHLGIEYSMNIPLFAFTMLAWYVSFLEVEAAWAWLRARRPLVQPRAQLWLRQGRLPLGLAPLLAATDLLGRLELLPLGPQERLPGQAGRPALVLRTAAGRQYTGLAALAWLRWRLPLLWPLALLWPLPGRAALLRLLARRLLAHHPDPARPTEALRAATQAEV